MPEVTYAGEYLTIFDNGAKMKGTIYHNAENYIPQGGERIWKKISEFHYQHEVVGGWFTFYLRFVTHSLDPKTNRKWEIQVGDTHVSRDKGAYFSTVDAAMLACEKMLVKSILEDIALTKCPHSKTTNNGFCIKCGKYMKRG